MSQGDADGSQHGPLGLQAERTQKPTGDQTRGSGFQSVHQNDSQGEKSAVVPEKVGKTSVSTAVETNVVMLVKPGDQHGTVQISQKIADRGGNEKGKPQAHSSLSPFCRMVIRTGVPCSPKTSRIWFSRYRW